MKLFNFNKLFILTLTLTLASFLMWTKPALASDTYIGTTVTVQGNIPVSVPEFGFIPGVIALLSSGGSFLFLKKTFQSTIFKTILY